MKQFFRSQSTRHQIERLIRDGVGVREAAWPVPGHAGAPAPEALVGPIVQWVRESMAAMRRPYGIDHVALALACRDGDGRVVCSNSFGVVQPATFYQDDGPERVAAFIGDLSAVPPGSRREIVGALLSLGDIAYELGVPRAA